MARDKKFLRHELEIVQMLEFGIPPAVMMEYFEKELSISSLKKYIEKIKLTGSYNGSVTGIPESRVHLFSLLMEKDKPYFVSFALERFFKLEELFSLLGYARYQIEELKRMAFASDIPEGYQKLLKVINGFQDSRDAGKYEIRSLGERLFRDCLHAIKGGKKEMPTRKILENIYDLANFIIKDNDKIIESRKEIAPFFTHKVCKSVDGVLLTLSERESYVLKSLYGLNKVKESYQNIAERLEMTVGRVQQIEQKAIRRCRYTSRSSMMGLFTLNWESIQERFEHRDHLLQDLREEVEKLKSLASES